MSSSQTLIQRSEAAQNELKKLRRRFQLGSWIFAIVAFGILAYAAGFFYYGYSQISDLKDPKYIVSLVGQLVDEQIPQARKTLESQVDENAADWAQQASDRAVAYVPTLRQQLEDFASKQADKAIEQLNVMGEKQFRKVLDENRDTMKKAFQDLEDDDEISEGVLLMLEENLAEKLQMDEDAMAGAPLLIVSGLNENGKNLLKAEKLSEEQEHERRVLMLVRRLQHVQFPDLKFGGLTLSPEITGSVEQLEHASLDKEKEAANAAAKTAEPSKEEASKPAEAEAGKASSEEAAKEVAKVKDDNAAKPKAEAKKTDLPKKAQSDGLSDDKKVAKAKPADK